jgi:hypothetical protein
VLSAPIRSALCSAGRDLAASGLSAFRVVNSAMRFRAIDLNRSRAAVEPRTVDSSVTVVASIAVDQDPLQLSYTGFRSKSLEIRTRLYYPCSPSLYMYLMADLYTSVLARPRTFRLLRSYHSIHPSTFSPSSSTITIGVWDWICFCR